jgi:AAA family ATP:ADP antiporter
MVAALRRFVDVRPGEGRAVAYAFAYFFCILSSYYVLRPLREAMGIVGNVKDLSRLFLVTLAATLVCTPLLAALVSRFPRRRFVPIVYRFFALNLVAFYGLLHGASVHPDVARAFFVWTSIFNLFALSVFWGLMADLFRREQSVRLFGLIGTGGTLGAMAGAFATAALAERVGIASLVLVSAVLLEVAVRCVQRLVATFGDTAGAARVAPERGLAEGGVWRWVLEIPRSPYLVGIIGYMLLFTLTSTFVYFEQARIVKAAVASTGARTALFAKMDLAVNVLSLVVQGLLVGPLLRRFGVGVVLALLPIVTVVGFVAIGSSPTLAVLVVFQVLRRAADYGLAKPSREVLFTVLPRESKYKAKGFIDTFVYRTGDAMGALADGALAKSLASILVVCVPVCLAWAAVALFLGRAGSRRRRVPAPALTADTEQASFTA